MLDEAAEQEPAGLRHGGIAVAVLPPGMAAVDHAEFEDLVAQALLLRLAGDEVEAPAVQLGPEAHLVEIGHHVLEAGRRVLPRLRRRVLLEIAVQHHLVPVVIGVEPVQHIGRAGLEPADRPVALAAGNQGEAGRQALVQAHGVDVPLQQLGVPEHRQVVEDGEPLGEGHVVGQAGARHVDGDIPLQLVVRADDPQVHVGGVLGIVEEQQLARVLVHLGMGGDAVDRHPGLHPDGLQRQRVEAIALAALVEGGQHHARMHHHVGGGAVLQRPVGAEARALRQLHRIGQPAPQGPAGLLLRLEAPGADEAIAIAGPAALEFDLVQHAVPVEGVVAAQRLVHRVLGVADIDPVYVLRDLAGDQLQVVGVHLLVQGRPGPVHVGVVAGLERGLHRRQAGEGHGRPPMRRSFWRASARAGSVPQSPAAARGEAG